MCEGEAKCRNESDLAWCQHEERKEEDCPRSDYVRCSSTLGMPGQCIWRNKVGDSKYQCVDRSDETPYSKTKPPLDLTRLQTCDTSAGTGLTCSDVWDGCLHRGDWRRSDYTSTCDELGGLPANIPELCTNFTFWSQHPCPEDWYRCDGANSGQCGGGGNGRKCEDKSDIYHPGNSSACELDSVRCNKKGEMVCLDLSLKCDMHPQCDEGEDEKDCSDTYVTRGLISPSATYRCQSPHHNDNSDTPTVTNWASRCDGREECFLGEDEADCDTKWIVYLALCEYSV